MFKGELPCPRYGHSAVLVEPNQVFVWGGWDTQKRFADGYLFDLSCVCLFSCVVL